MKVGFSILLAACTHELGAPKWTQTAWVWVCEFSKHHRWRHQLHSNTTLHTLKQSTPCFLLCLNLFSQNKGQKLLLRVCLCRASRGIGRAVAIALASENATVIVSARSTKDLEEVRQCMIIAKFCCVDPFIHLSTTLCQIKGRPAFQFHFGRHRPINLLWTLSRLKWLVSSHMGGSLFYVTQFSSQMGIGSHCFYVTLQTASACKSKGAADAHIITADMSSMAGVDQLSQTVLQQFGPIDILVNNAGIATRMVEPKADIWQNENPIEGVLRSPLLLPGVTRGKLSCSLWRLLDSDLC